MKEIICEIDGATLSEDLNEIKLYVEVDGKKAVFSVPSDAFGFIPKGLDKKEELIKVINILCEKIPNENNFYSQRKKIRLIVE